MIKKVLLVLLCGIIIFGITGCGNDTEKSSGGNSQKAEDKVETLECSKENSDNWTKVSSKYVVTFTNGEFDEAVLTNEMTILSDWYRKTIDEYLDSIERIYSGYDLDVEKADEESTTYHITLDKDGIETDLDTRITGDDVPSYKTALESDGYMCN